MQKDDCLWGAYYEHPLPILNYFCKFLSKDIWFTPMWENCKSFHLWDFSELAHLTLSWQRSLSYRKQSIDLSCKSMDWFLYDRGLRHERVNVNVPFLYALKTFENHRFSDIFRGGKKATLTSNELISCW